MGFAYIPFSKEQYTDSRVDGMDNRLQDGRCQIFNTGLRLSN